MLATHKELFQLAGIPVIKVTTNRIKKEERNEALFYYELRHSDFDWGEPCNVEKFVGVNFYGTVVTTQPIKELERPDCDEWLFVELSEDDVQNIYDWENTEIYRASIWNIDQKKWVQSEWGGSVTHTEEDETKLVFFDEEDAESTLFYLNDCFPDCYVLVEEEGR